MWFVSADETTLINADTGAEIRCVCSDAVDAREYEASIQIFGPIVGYWEQEEADLRSVVTIFQGTHDEAEFQFHKIRRQLGAWHLGRGTQTTAAQSAGDEVPVADEAMPF